jgi:hypothetical protein
VRLAVRRAPRVRGIRVSSAGAGAGPGVGAGLGVGLALGLLALGPGLRRGFLLSYDMVFVPREPFTATMFGLSGGPPRAVPSDAVVAVASRVLPADLVQKLLLLSIFVLACSGAAALLGRQPWLARLAAGVFYAWNPFVAERLIIGQWALLLGYAGLPWVLRSVISNSVTSWRGAGRLGLALLPAAVGGFAAMAISALVAVPAAMLARAPAGEPTPGGSGLARPARRPIGAAVAGAAALLVLAACSLPWLIPSLLHPVYADPAGAAAFAARADTPFGSFGSLLMLGGIWNAQTVPAAYGGTWSTLWLALVIVAAAGYAMLAGGPGRWMPAARAGRWPGLGVAAVAGLAIASIGLTTSGRELLRAASGLWPGFAVLRDSQQFVAPLALAEAVGLGLVVTWAMRPSSPGARSPSGTGSRSGAGSPSGVRSQLGMHGGQRGGDDQPARPDRPGLAIGAAALLAPVLLLPGLAWGAAGRLRPVWYPASWLAAARVIDESRAQGAALLLPWAAYRRPAWNGGEATLDPWPRLLSRPVIWNDGVRVGDVHMAPDDPRARRLDGALRSSGPLTAVLKAAGVRFVIVDAGGPAGGRLPGCTTVIIRPGLAVYRVPGRPGHR